MRSKMLGIGILFSLLFFFAGCGGTSGGRSNTNPSMGGKSKTNPSMRGEGDSIKITYFRYTELKQKSRFRTEYWVMQSETWDQEHQGRGRYPFHKLVDSPFIAPRVPDRFMRALYDKIDEGGFETLPETDMKTLDIRFLHQLTRDLNSRKIRAHRYITVERGKYRRTICYKDILDPTFTMAHNKTVNKAFWQVEKAVLTSQAKSFCVKISKGTAPFFLDKDR